MLDKCAKCGAPARIRRGYYGQYAECSRWPEHNGTDFHRTALLAEAEWNAEQKRIAEIGDKHKNMMHKKEMDY